MESLARVEFSRFKEVAKELVHRGPPTDQCSQNRGKPENGKSEGASQRVALSGLWMCSKGRCQIWHPGRTRYAAPLLSIPESSERFRLYQGSVGMPTPAADAPDAISQLHPAHGKAKTHMAGLSTLPSLHFIPLD